MEYTYGDIVVYGIGVGSEIYWDITKYTYLCKNTRGKYVLENMSNGEIFLATNIKKI